MKRAEILLNLVIGICGSLIAAVIYSRLPKIRLRKISKGLIGKTKQATNDALVTGVIAAYTYKKSILRPSSPVASVLMAFLLLLTIFPTYILFTKHNTPIRHSLIAESQSSNKGNVYDRDSLRALLEKAGKEIEATLAESRRENKEPPPNKYP